MEIITEVRIKTESQEITALRLIANTDGNVEVEVDDEETLIAVLDKLEEQVAFVRDKLESGDYEE